MDAEVAAEYPLSFPQERFWLLEQLTPGGGLYNLPCAIRLEGPIGVERLERALADVVQKHEALRTTLHTVGGRPVQRVHRSHPLSLRVVDLVDELDRGSDALERTMVETARHPFEMDELPLFVAVLVRQAAEEHVLVLVFHHAIVDGPSLEMILRDLGECYTTPRHPELASLPTTSGASYGAVAVDSRAIAESKGFHARLATRVEALTGAPAVLNLPADYPRPPARSGQGAEVRFVVDAALASAARNLARTERVTPFTVCATALALVLARFSGESDIVLGIPISARTDAAHEEIVGCFLNTMPIRVNVSPSASFASLLHAVRDEVLVALDYQDVPYEALLSGLQPDRQLSHNPVFQVLFAYYQTTGAPMEIPEVASTVIDYPDTGSAKFDLTFGLSDRGAEIDGSVEYSTDLFSEESAQQYADAFLAVLGAVCDRSDRSISHVPLLAPHQRRRIVERCAAASRAGEWMPVVGAFHDQARARPEATAIRHGDHAVSYGDLCERASAAAARVRTVASPGQVAALIAPRGVDFIAGLIGILEAGAVCLPIDPACPAPRARAMLDDAQCSLIVVGSDRALSDGDIGMRPLVELADMTAPFVRDDVFHPRASDAAYVMYTSGTTGAPKAAVVEHLGMARHMAAKISDVGLSASDVIAQNGPSSFDIVIWQCLAPLLVGASVDVIDDNDVRDPWEFAARLVSGGVTILQIVPAVLSSLFAAGVAEQLSGLRWLVPTGEALPTELVDAWAELHPRIPILNTYGVTECSDDQCHLPIYSREVCKNASVAPLGSAIAGASVYVLDEALDVLPIGVVGEITIGGDVVGRGYANSPRETASRFVPDPFTDVPGGRLYRTGDRGRYRWDGVLEYVGRSDTQVKVRGHRVEPLEIENALRRLPGITGAAVVAHSANGAVHLFAYATVDGSAEISVEAIRRALGAQLPAYMVPAFIEIIAELPLTPNGKVDRSAMMQWPRITPTREIGGGAPPTTDVERQLVEIWESALGVAGVGVDDDFFDRGGDSLLSVLVVARAADASLPLTVRALFECRTIRRIANAIAAVT